jgi:hypothetical protein
LRISRRGGVPKPADVFYRNDFLEHDSRGRGRVGWRDRYYRLTQRPTHFGSALVLLQPKADEN